MLSVDHQEERAPETIEELQITGQQFGRLMKIADVTARNLAAFIDKRDGEAADGRRGKIAHSPAGIWKMRRRNARQPIPLRYVRMLRDCIGEKSFWTCYARLADELRKEESIRKLRTRR